MQHSCGILGILQRKLIHSRWNSIVRRIHSCWLDCVICHYNVIPLINTVFPTVSGQVYVNQRAIANCGWGPLNQKHVEHPNLYAVEPAALAYFLDGENNALGVSIQNAGDLQH